MTRILAQSTVGDGMNGDTLLAHCYWAARVDAHRVRLHRLLRSIMFRDEQRAVETRDDRRRQQPELACESTTDDERVALRHRRQKGVVPLVAAYLMEKPRGTVFEVPATGCAPVDDARQLDACVGALIRSWMLPPFAPFSDRASRVAGTIVVAPPHAAADEASNSISSSNGSGGNSSSSSDSDSNSDSGGSSITTASETLAFPPSQNAWRVLQALVHEDPTRWRRAVGCCMTNHTLACEARRQGRVHNTCSRCFQSFSALSYGASERSDDQTCVDYCRECVVWRACDGNCGRWFLSVEAAMRHLVGSIPCLNALRERVSQQRATGNGSNASRSLRSASSSPSSSSAAPRTSPLSNVGPVVPSPSAGRRRPPTAVSPFFPPSFPSSSSSSSCSSYSETQTLSPSSPPVSFFPSLLPSPPPSPSAAATNKDLADDTERRVQASKRLHMETMRNLYAERVRAAHGQTTTTAAAVGTFGEFLDEQKRLRRQHVFGDQRNEQSRPASASPLRSQSPDFIPLSDPSFAAVDLAHDRGSGHFLSLGASSDVSRKRRHENNSSSSSSSSFVASSGGLNASSSGTSGSSSSSLLSTDSNGWVCELCTLENVWTTDRCHACAEPRRDGKRSRPSPLSSPSAFSTASSSSSSSPSPLPTAVPSALDSWATRDRRDSGMLPCDPWQEFRVSNDRDDGDDRRSEKLGGGFLVPGGSVGSDSGPNVSNTIDMTIGDDDDDDERELKAPHSVSSLSGRFSSSPSSASLSSSSSPPPPLSFASPSSLSNGIPPGRRSPPSASLDLRLDWECRCGEQVALDLLQCTRCGIGRRRRGRVGYEEESKSNGEQQPVRDPTDVDVDGDRGDRKERGAASSFGAAIHRPSDSDGQWSAGVSPQRETMSPLSAFSPPAASYASLSPLSPIMHTLTPPPSSASSFVPSPRRPREPLLLLAPKFGASPWNCSKCTYHNRINTRSCEMCLSSRD